MTEQEHPYGIERPTHDQHFDRAEPFICDGRNKGHAKPDDQCLETYGEGERLHTPTTDRVANRYQEQTETLPRPLGNQNDQGAKNKYQIGTAFPGDTWHRNLSATNFAHDEKFTSLLVRGRFEQPGFH